MSARISFRTSLSVFVTALASAGCDDSLKSISLIEETRVLGARIEVEADPLRASPQPGEQASLRFFVVSADGAPNVSYALSVCAVHWTSIGFPPCASAPFASTVQIDSSSAEPRLE